MWQSTRDLIAFHVQEVWTNGETTYTAKSLTEFAAPFVVPMIPKGGPWIGRYVADALQVAFVPGTSPTEAAAFAGRHALTVDWAEQPTPNLSAFNTAPGDDAATRLEEVAGAEVVCSSSLFRFTEAFDEIPIDTPQSCLEPVGIGVGTLVRVTAGGAQVRVAPSASAQALRPKLPADWLADIIDGPVHADNVDWWQVVPRYDFARSRRYPAGWIGATRPDGVATLLPSRPDSCPPLGYPVSTQSIAVTIRNDSADAVSCYGSGELAFDAVVSCTNAIVDPAVGGVDWIVTDCSADDRLHISMSPELRTTSFGQEGGFSTWVSGVYEVRGHFDDPRADNCFAVGVGTVITTPTNPPDPEAVLICREDFVVTSLKPRTLASIVGTTRPYRLLFECVDKSILFAGERWIPEPGRRAGWGPGFGSEELGSMEVVSEDHAVYSSPVAGDLPLDRADVPPTMRCPSP